MDIQTALVVILFVLALAYLARIIYRSLTPKNGGCGTNCKCGVDFSNIPPDQK